MESRTPLQRSLKNHVSRALARGKRRPRITVLARLLFIVMLIGSTVVWQDSTRVVAASGNRTGSGPVTLLQSTSVSGSAPASITTTVSDTSGSLQNGIIDIEVYNAANQKVGQQFFDGQNLAAGQAVTQNIQWTAPSAGSYRVKVGVFGTNWSSLIMWNDDAADFTVSTANNVVPPPATTVPATNTPPATAVPATSTPVPATSMALLQSTSVSGSAPANITTTVSDTSGSLQNGIIDIEVYNAANQRLAQQFFPGQNLAAGQAVTENMQWTAPSAGSYRVKVGVFGTNWSSMIMWNDDAADFTVAAAGATSIPATATATTAPATNTPSAPTSTAVPATSTVVPATNTPVPATATTTGSGSGSSTGCRFQTADQPVHVAFCDTFNASAGTGNRSGGLNGLFWGASRTSQNTNPGQGIYNGWVPASRTACGSPAQPDQDIAVCNGQLVEAVNDDHGFTTLAMYPTQPFDIAGRTGTAVFDVTADSEGPHAAWPSFIYTDQPVPAPTDNHTTTAAFARNSFGFSLDQDPASCGSSNHTGVSEVYATSNYVERGLSFTPVNNCLTNAPGVLNHFEVRISQSRVEVWGTNAGSSTLQELGFVANAGLTLTRGLIWMEDQHYNADKFNDQGTHTFIWDNVGFDGPTLARDLHLDVNDALNRASDGSLNLGWYAPDPSSGTPLSLTVPGATDLAQSSGALLTLNFFPTDTSSIQYRLNGHAWHTLAWPFPDSLTYQWRTIGIPVDLSEIQAGNNTLDLEATKGGATVSNLDLILVGAQGVVQ